MKGETITIKLNGALIEGSDNCMTFTDFDEEEQFDLDWKEVWQACQNYINSYTTEIRKIK